MTPEAEEGVKGVGEGLTELKTHKKKEMADERKMTRTHAFP
jgi:hypothetical protein